MTRAGSLRAPGRGGRALATLLLLLSLAACDGEEQTGAQILAPPPAADPPQLWLVQAVGDTGAQPAAIYVCADARLREAFTRTLAKVDGKRCKDATFADEKENGWALRCVAGGRPFAVSAATIGDLQQDFRFDLALTPLDYLKPLPQREPAAVRRSQRFRRVGPCPTGWRVGDRARPGHPPRRT